MIDILLVGILLFMIVLGYHRGFVWQILKFARLLVMLVIIYIFGNQIALFLLPFIKPLISQFLLQGVTGSLKDQIASFIIRLCLPMILVFVVGIITKQLLRLFHGKIIKNIPIVGMLNAILGSIVSVLESVFIFLLVVALLPVIGSEWNTYVVQNSYFVRLAQEQIPYLINMLQMFWS